MAAREAQFSQLDELSDIQLLDGLEKLVLAGRRVTADLVRHLAEVEHRRLHLKAGFGSLFSYCVEQWGMSEDEACRRIEVARLGRRFPLIFAMLASGEVTLSVVALLKPHMREENQGELLAAVASLTVRAAREVLAARFPQADAPSSIRKLSDPRPSVSATPASSTATKASPVEVQKRAVDTSSGELEPVAALATPVFASGTTPKDNAPEPDHPPPALTILTTPTSTTFSRVEPLSQGRYRVQFTAGSTLKQKLELARDLSRHRNPSGDFAVIVERALDALIAELRRDRFGETSKRRRPGNLSAKRVSRQALRAVAQRDGLSCSFTGGDGRRCGAIAFLEYDHKIPRGKGGSSEPENLRLLCRAHNQLTAELEYGTEHMKAASSRRREQHLPSTLARDIGESSAPAAGSGG